MTAHPAGSRSIPERLAAIATGLSAAIVVVAIAILPFLTPAWFVFEQGRTNAAVLTGYSEGDLHAATNAILHDLVLGPPDFAVEVAGSPVLEERERAHMRNVRGAFAGFALLAAVAAAVLVAGVVGARRVGHLERAWSAVGTGMRVLVVAIIVAAIVATVAFDAAFEVFHRLLFAGGSYTFDPRTDRLVQLFPMELWSETTIVFGGVIVVLAVVVAVAAGRLARGAAAASTARASTGPFTTAEAGR